VIEHAVKAQLADMRAASEARGIRLEAARARERKARSTANGAFRLNSKRVKLGADDGGAGPSSGVDKGDDRFLPEDKPGEADEGDGVCLSKEVRDLMAK
jgi:hypothetical protein